MTNLDKEYTAELHIIFAQGVPNVLAQRAPVNMIIKHNDIECGDIINLWFTQLCDQFLQSNNSYKFSSVTKFEAEGAPGLEKD